MLRALIPVPRQEEEVEQPAQPEQVQSEPVPGGWGRLRRWWSGRQVGTQLLVGIVAGLITTGIMAAVVTLLT